MASRTVGPRWNAAAISGEYLSAASFLGVAGLVAKYGADALWYPVGFTAGYLGLLLVASAPLRRSGAYTVPDFVGMMKDTKNGELKAQGKVIDGITEDQEEYYGFDEAAFPDPSPDGRVLMLLSYP